MIEEAGNHPSIFCLERVQRKRYGNARGDCLLPCYARVHSQDRSRPICDYADDNFPKLERAEDLLRTRLTSF